MLRRVVSRRLKKQLYWYLASLPELLVDSSTFGRVRDDKRRHT